MDEKGHQFLWAEEVRPESFPSDSPVLRFRDYWERLRGARALPLKADIDPLGIDRDMLPWLFIFEIVERDGRRDYLCRLCGTGNVKLVGRDATGRHARDIFEGPQKAFMLDTFQHTIDRAAPTYWRAAIPHRRVERVDVNRGLFPFSQAGDAVNFLVGMAVPVED